MSTSPDAGCWFTADAPGPHPRMPGQPQDSLRAESFTAHRHVLVPRPPRLGLLNTIGGGRHLQPGLRVGEWGVGSEEHFAGGPLRLEGGSRGHRVLPAVYPGAAGLAQALRWEYLPHLPGGRGSAQSLK